MSLTCLFDPHHTVIVPEAEAAQHPDMMAGNFIFRADGRVVTWSGSDEMGHFHQLLLGEFKPGEVEPIEVFERELDRGDFILTSVVGPIDNPAMISGAYGSVVPRNEKEGILAIRFTLTEIAARGSGASQVADRLLITEASRLLAEDQLALKCLICEGVKRSEHYWNTIGVTQDEGMKRIYGVLPSGELEEIAYSLPPLEWNSDGSPIGEGIPEHLMILWRGSPDTVQKNDLKDVLKVWWDQWYTRPIEDFESSNAHRQHTQFVEQFLANNVVTPLDRYTSLRLLSREQREELRNEGQIIIEQVI